MRNGTVFELDKEFVFLGRQYHLEVGDKDFYIDLLFYHINLRCFVVVELKAGEFEPKDAGQLNFYLSAIDRTLKKAEDNPTIGILLVKTKNNLVAEYALQGIKKLIAIVEYGTKVEEFEAEFEKVRGKLS